MKKLCVKIDRSRVIDGPACDCIHADGVAVHGSVQTEIDVVEDDKAINTPEYDQRFLFNVYADVNVISQYVEAGLRFEFMKWPTPQFLKEPGYAGWGFLRTSMSRG